MLIVFLSQKIATAVPATPAAPPPVNHIITQVDCKTAYAEFFQDKDALEQLISPDLSDELEISNRVALYRRVYECLDAISDPPGDYVILKKLVEMFLVIVGGDFTPPAYTSLSLVSLNSSDDQAVTRLREQLGIKPPHGYVYVRYYSSRDAMPDIVRRAFKDETVRGVTIFVRYIAVIQPEDSNPFIRQLQSGELSTTVSHELVHAYVNSAVGWKNSFELPRWYSEGSANYFSGSAKVDAVVTRDFSYITTPTKDYQQYDLNFKYLEAAHGRDQFEKLIRQSVEQNDPSILYSDLGIAGEDDLARRAAAWGGKQEAQRIEMVVGAIVVLVVVALVVEHFSKPKCPYCGHRSSKALYSYGFCPKCLRPIGSDQSSVSPTDVT